MTESQALELITATFIAGWTAAMPDVPYTLRNEVLPSADTFVLMTATITTSKQTTQGPRATRRLVRNGWVQIKTWTPANGGALPSAALADAARGIFELRDVPSVVAGDEAMRFYEGTSMAPVQDDRWESQVVRVPFTFVDRPQ